MAYGAFMRAIETGDVLSIRVARDTWLKLTEGLRRFDQQVEASRRAASETLPRVEAERVLHGVFTLLGHGILRLGMTMALQLPGAGPAEVRRLVVDGLLNETMNSFAGFKGATFAGRPLPDWAWRACLRDVDGRFKNVEAVIAARAEAITKAMNESTETTTQTPAPSPPQAPTCAATVNSPPHQ